MSALREDFQHRLSAVSEMVTHLAARLENLSDKVDKILEEIRIIKIRLDSKVDYKDFYDLDRRLTALEEKVNGQLNIPV